MVKEISRQTETDKK